MGGSRLPRLYNYAPGGHYNHAPGGLYNYAPGPAIVLPFGNSPAAAGGGSFGYNSDNLRDN